MPGPPAQGKREGQCGRMPAGGPRVPRPSPSAIGKRRGDQPRVGGVRHRVVASAQAEGCTEAREWLVGNGATVLAAKGGRPPVNPARGVSAENRDFRGK